MKVRPLIPALSAYISGILINFIFYPQIFSIIPVLFTFTLILLVLSVLKKFSTNRYIVIVIFLIAGIQISFISQEHSELTATAGKYVQLHIEGTVLNPSKQNRNNTKVEIIAEQLFMNKQIKKIREKLLVTVYNNEKIFSPGEKIRFPAKIKSIQNFKNHGRYNYELAMRLRGFFYSASVSDGRLVVPMGKGNADIHLLLLEAIRKPIRNLLNDTLSQNNQAIYRALILGERQGIDNKIREPFLITGLGHILAVSGLHIGLIAWLTFTFSHGLLSCSYYLTLKIDIRKTAAIITCIPVIAYTFLSGFQLSSQRAMIMALVYLCSIILQREKEVWSTLAFAAFLVLALDPNALFSISFQLSFLAVIGILWLAPVFYEWFPKTAAPEKRDFFLYRFYMYVAGLFAITMSVIIFLLPISSFYFHRIPLISIISNLTTVPLLGIWVLPLGFLSAIAVHISPALAEIVLQTGSFGLSIMLYIIDFWAQFHWSDILVITPNMLEIILYYNLLLCIYFLKKWPHAKSGLILVLILISIDASYWIYQTQFNPRLRINYFDVGQGNSALIRFPGGQRMLIDGGGFSSDTFDVGRMVIAPSLLSLKIRRIDYLVLSHPQSDHMNGLRYIASKFNPKEFWFNGDLVGTPSFIELMEIINSNKIKIVSPRDLSKGYVISGVEVNILHPIHERQHTGTTNENNNLNNNSLVIKLTYEGKSLLFPGDLEISGEKQIVAKAGSVLKSNILLVPHHGSRTSCSKIFLKTVKPEIGIISSGKNNYFRFPHEDTVRRLEEAGCRIIRIDQLGEVRLTLKKNQITIKTYEEGFTF